MQITAGMVKELRERTGAGMMECKKALVECGGDIEAALEHLRKTGLAKADKKAGRVAAEGVVAVAIDAGGARGVMVEVNCETDFVAKQDEFQAFADAVAARALAAGVDSVEALLALPFDAAGGESIDERQRGLVAKIGEKITVRRVERLDSGSGALAAYVHNGRIGVLVDIAGGDDELGKDIAMHVAWSRPNALDESGVPEELLAKERTILEAQIQETAKDKPAEIQAKMLAGRVAKFLREITLLGQPFVKDPNVTVEKHLAAHKAKVSGFRRLEVGEGIEKKSENFADEVMAQVRGA
ncbi:MAG: elongation factor Ts [Ectothiorhodospiraceae bacterium]|nr:elongation factor Ts [Chromatiales bacterium]MCP5156912.1 elongation factor Ts [Ectothiorhodospiraceae bacterium]